MTSRSQLPQDVEQQTCSPVVPEPLIGKNATEEYSSAARNGGGCYNRATMNRKLHTDVLVATLCMGIALFGVSRGRSQDAKSATPTQDDLQSRVEDLADYIAPFAQEGTGKVIVFDLVGPKGLRAPFGNWLADQISATIAQRFPALQVIDRSTVNSLLDKRNRDADHGDSKKDRAFAEQAGAETFISGSFSKTPRGIRISFTGVAPKPRSMTFFAILPLTDQVAKLLPPGLETETPKGESSGRDSVPVGKPQCLWCPITFPGQKATQGNCHGTFVLNVLVSDEGRATDIQNVDATEACADQIKTLIVKARKWWFQPAQSLDGKAEAKMFTLRLTFQ